MSPAPIVGQRSQFINNDAMTPYPLHNRLHTSHRGLVSMRYDVNKRREVFHMKRLAKNMVRAGCLVCALTVLVSPYAVAAEWEHEGMAEPGKWTAGFRVGPSFITQGSVLNTTGPALNFQALYVINQWFRLGSMLEWENYGFDRASGSLDTVTLLPLLLEYRPGHFGGSSLTSRPASGSISTAIMSRTRLHGEPLEASIMCSATGFRPLQQASCSMLKSPGSEIRQISASYPPLAWCSVSAIPFSNQERCSGGNRQAQDLLSHSNRIKRRACWWVGR